jgi:hypothetical protein
MSSKKLRFDDSSSTSSSSVEVLPPPVAASVEIPPPLKKPKKVYAFKCDRCPNWSDAQLYRAQLHLVSVHGCRFVGRGRPSTEIPPAEIPAALALAKAHGRDRNAKRKEGPSTESSIVVESPRRSPRRHKSQPSAAAGSAAQLIDPPFIPRMISPIQSGSSTTVSSTAEAAAAVEALLESPPKRHRGAKRPRSEKSVEWPIVKKEEMTRLKASGQRVGQPSRQPPTVVRVLPPRVPTPPQKQPRRVQRVAKAQLSVEELRAQRPDLLDASAVAKQILYAPSLQGREIVADLQKTYPAVDVSRWVDVVDVALVTRQLLVRELRHAFHTQAVSVFAGRFRRFSHKSKQMQLVHRQFSAANDRLPLSLLGAAPSRYSDETASSDDPDHFASPSARAGSLGLGRGKPAEYGGDGSREVGQSVMKSGEVKGKGKGKGKGPRK